MTPEQAKALRESATNVIAHEKSLENEKQKLEAELERVSRNARQAVMMAEESTQAGDLDKATSFTESSEALATHMVTIEQQIAAIDIELIEARQAADEARSMASDSAIKTAQMRAKGAELRADFERAKIDGGSLATTGVPSYDEVKSKINDQLAQAEARAEIEDADGSVTAASATAMVEKAAHEAKAASKLAEIRSSLGLSNADISGPSNASDDAPDSSDQQDG